MPVTINGTTGFSFPEGSSGTPSIKGQDADTGIFFPENDTIAFAEGGSEVLRINSSGNVGIGTTNPAQELHIFKSSGNCDVRVQSGTSDGYLDLYHSGSGLDGYGLWGTSSTSRMRFGTNFVERLTISAGGNVGIGTTNPSFKLDVFNSGGNSAIRTRTDISSGYSYYILQNIAASGREYHLGLGGPSVGGGAAGSVYLYDITASAFRWVTDSSGNFLIGSTSATGTASQPLQVTGGGYFSGNVGIGITNPSNKLTVSGDANITGTATASTLVASKLAYGAPEYTNSTFGNGWVLAAPASTTYYKIATLPASTFGTFDHLTIEGLIGGWNKDTMTPFKMTFSNRDGFDYKYESYGTVRTEVKIIGISTNNTTEIWAQHSIGGYTKLVYNVTNSVQVTVVANPTSTTTAPLGTTVFDSSSATYKPRFLIDESDNVIIGSASATGTASQRLQVTGGAYVSGSVGIGVTNPNNVVHIENFNSTYSSPETTNVPNIYVLNTNSNTATAHAIHTLRVNGANSGDPFVSFDIAGVNGWSCGVDNSDSDKFKISNNWADLGTNPAIVVDTSRRVTFPSQPTFCGIATYGGSWVGSLTPMIFASNRINTGNHYSTSNGRFTCPIAGVYEVYVQGHVQSVTGYTTIRIKVNGTIVSNAWSSNITGSIVASHVDDLVANDYIEIDMVTDKATNYIAETYWVQTVKLIG